MIRRSLVALSLLPLSALAQTQVPNVFEDGTPASAAEVNENFDALEAALPPSDCTTDQFIRWDGSSWVCSDFSGLVWMLDTGEAVGVYVTSGSIYMKIASGVGAFSKITTYTGVHSVYENHLEAYFSDPDCRGNVASVWAPQNFLFNSADGYQYVYSGGSRSNFQSRSYGRYLNGSYLCTAGEALLVDAWPLTQAGGTPTWIVTGQSVSAGLK